MTPQNAHVSKETKQKNESHGEKVIAEKCSFGYFCSLYIMSKRAHVNQSWYDLMTPNVLDP